MLESLNPLILTCLVVREIYFSQKGYSVLSRAFGACKYTERESYISGTDRAEKFGFNFTLE